MTTTTNTDGNTDGRATPGGRARTVRRVVITLVVVVGLLVGIDFGAAAMAEYQVSKRARDAFGLADDPAVTILGFPFLTQAFSGEYGHITVDATGVPINEMRDVEIHADLYGAHAPLSDLLSGTTNTITVDQVEGQIRVKATDFNRAIQSKKLPVPTDITNVTIAPASLKTVNTSPDEVTDGTSDDSGNGNEPTGDDTTAGLQVGATIDIAGQRTDVTVFGIIQLTGGKVVVTPKRVELNNAMGSDLLSKPLQNQFLQLFAVTLDPGQLPFAVTPTAVRVDPGSIAMTGKASNVSLANATG